METTEDAFLGGRLRVQQPAEGYRAGADPVFLAAAVAASPGESVLDLGCGVGVAMMCLKARSPEVRVTGVDIQRDLVSLARENLALNALDGDVFEGDAGALPAEIRSRTFDHVMTNPPFFRRQSGSNARNPGREIGRRETMALADWIDAGLRRLRPGGSFVLVNRIERLSQTLAAVDARVGAIRLQPLAPRDRRPAKLFVLKGRKGAKSDLVLLPPFVLHAGASHEADADSYTQQAQLILRHGGALDLSD